MPGDDLLAIFGADLFVHFNYSITEVNKLMIVRVQISAWFLDYLKYRPITTY